MRTKKSKTFLCACLKNKSELALENNIKGKPAHLIFQADTVQKTNLDKSILVDRDPHFSKALPSKNDGLIERDAGNPGPARHLSMPTAGAASRLEGAR